MSAPWYSGLELRTLDGDPLPEDAFEGKALLFVNVASRCGLTPQYTGLVRLHSELGGEGFEVVGVPCNQFGAQEPGSPEEIRTFCATTYGVDFPLLEKQDVNGPDRSALYRHLIGDGPDIEWNFAKFLVAPDGTVVKRFAPQTPPEDGLLRVAIAEAIATP
ncbi:MAG: glutathione peroxidase [Deltaproteobacteria bacterium]|nr:glutathione peroxidase [Deltaproteobacteria bacterium]MCB9786127.1 glutathione peroxidase [Deltaproteobacteria bacterium]